MIRRTPLYIACSPRPRVGKTLLARLLVDFFLLEGREVAAFQLDDEEPSLRDYLPRHTKTAAITNIRGQMAFFDGLLEEDNVAKVVDLAPAAFEQFFSVLRQIGFVEEARRRSIEPIAVFPADPDRHAVRAYGDLGRRLADLTLVPVYNDAVARGPELRDLFAPSQLASVPMHIPLLIPLLHRYIDKPPFSFADFRSTPPGNIPLENYMELYRWARHIFVEFRELELRLLLGEVQASLSPDAAQAVGQMRRSQ